jgi:drug/metabolite transporter (DMT)-like permease
MKKAVDSDVTESSEQGPLNWQSPRDHLVALTSALISAGAALVINSWGKGYELDNALPAALKQFVYNYSTSFLFGRICAYYAVQTREQLKAVLVPSLLNGSAAFAIHSFDFLGKTNRPLASAAYVFLGSIAGFTVWAKIKKSGKLDTISLLPQPNRTHKPGS